MLKMLKTSRVDIDRTMAELYLSYERRPEAGVKGTNRRHSKRVVNEYAGSMVDGEWRLTHQGIGFMGFFDRGDAELIDGGHRMRAVILADEEKPGIVIPFMVTEGMTAEDKLALDIGRKRNPGTFLEMDGELDTNVLAAVGKLTWLYLNGLMDSYQAHSRSAITPLRLKQHLEEFPDLRQAVAEGRRLKNVVAPTAAGSFWFLATHTEQDTFKVAEFTDGLISGENLAYGDPRLTLRNSMFNAARIHRTREAHENLALLIKSFVKFRDGEELIRLAWRVDEAFPTF